MSKSESGSESETENKIEKIEIEGIGIDESKKVAKKATYQIVRTVEGKNVVIFKNKKQAPIMSFEDTIQIDNRSPEAYKNYYVELLPFYKQWYNCDDVEGYRPVVKATNLVANIEKNNVRKKCWCIKCLIPGHQEEKELKRVVFNPLPNTKLGCWRCELIGDIPDEYVIDIPENMNEEDIKKLKPHVPRDPMASAFDRYVTYKSKLLYNIEMFEKVPTMFRGVRTMYWQPCIRSEKLKNVATDNSFKQIVGLNPVIDIDVLNKHVKTVFDYWEENWKLLCDVSKVLEDNGLEYKIMFSGNGWYFILKRISLKDNEQQLVNEQFWNILTEGTKSWLTENVKPIQEKYHFDIQVGNMNPMKFVKAPFSIHQRLDTVAVPLTLDMFNSMFNDKDSWHGSSEMRKFQGFVDIKNIRDTFKQCESVFGANMKDLVSW